LPSESNSQWLGQCFKIIESTCLSHPLPRGQRGGVGGVPAPTRRALHALLQGRDPRVLHVRLRAVAVAPPISKGDEVPEVILAGTSSRHTELGPVEQGRVPLRYRDGKKRPRVAMARSP
jgi:hypothetical protein